MADPLTSYDPIGRTSSGQFTPGNTAGRLPRRVRGLAMAAEVMRSQQRHPVDELIKLADSTSDKRLKRDIWIALLTYVEAPQKEPPAVVPETPIESVEAAQATMAKLAELSKPLDPKS